MFKKQTNSQKNPKIKDKLKKLKTNQEEKDPPQLLTTFQMEIISKNDMDGRILR